MCKSLFSRDVCIALLTPYVLFFQREQKHIYILFHSSTLKWQLTYSSAIVYSQIMGVDVLATQGISKHDIYYVELECFGPRTLRVNLMQ